MRVEFHEKDKIRGGGEGGSREAVTCTRFPALPTSAALSWLLGRRAVSNIICGRRVASDSCVILGKRDYPWEQGRIETGAVSFLVILSRLYLLCVFDVFGE